MRQHGICPDFPSGIFNPRQVKEGASNRALEGAEPTGNFRSLLTGFRFGAQLASVGTIGTRSARQRPGRSQGGRGHTAVHSTAQHVVPDGSFVDRPFPRSLPPATQVSEAAGRGAGVARRRRGAEGVGLQRGSAAQSCAEGCDVISIRAPHWRESAPTPTGPKPPATPEPSEASPPLLSPV